MGKTVQISVSILGTEKRSRLSTKRLLEAMKGFVCVGFHRDAREALVAIKTFRPDLMLVDVPKIDSSVLRCVSRAKELSPRLRVLILTRLMERHGLLVCLMTGVTGYWVKPLASSELTRAIGTVAKGGISLCPAAAQELAKIILEYHQSARPGPTLRRPNLRQPAPPR